MTGISLTPTDEGIVKIFYKGRYVGYIDSDQKLFGFDRNGYAEEIAILTWSGEAGAKMMDWLKRS